MQMETRAAMGLATAATTKPDLFFWFNYSITNPDSVVGVVAGSERNKAWHTAHAWTWRSPSLTGIPVPINEGVSLRKCDQVPGFGFHEAQEICAQHIPT
jgi:hypothetical protein